VKKPFVWRPGSPQGPIPGREVKRGRRPPRIVAPAVVPLETSTVVDSGSLTFGPPELTFDVVKESARMINAMDRVVDSAFEAMYGVRIGSRESYVEMWPVPRAAFTGDDFEALNAQIMRRGPTFEVDVAGRCMVCGLFGCDWWAAFCAWRRGEGARPNWRDGSIDTTCESVGSAPPLLVEASSKEE
jgi:hypothetical protein